jgi:chloramphenicol O-acetyltransferase type A
MAGERVQIIDVNHWSRKEHFEFFNKMDYPQFNISMQLEVTNFLAFVKRNKISFYYAMVFCATHCANQLENFRYRIRDDKVILHEELHPSFTDMMQDSDLYKMVMVEMEDDILAFSEKAKEKSNRQKTFMVYENEEERDDLLYMTCVPWVSFTQITHPIALRKGDSVPKISWGKYFREGEKVFLPFSVQANHALMDGVHVGKYMEILQNYLNNL